MNVSRLGLLYMFLLYVILPTCTMILVDKVCDRGFLKWLGYIVNGTILGLIATIYPLAYMISFPLLLGSLILTNIYYLFLKKNRNSLQVGLSMGLSLLFAAVSFSLVIYLQQN